MKKLILILFCLNFLIACAHRKAISVSGGDASSASAAKSGSMPQMSPQEMEARMKEAATPGEGHARLNALVGRWKTESKFWMDPSKAPEVGKGSATNSWIYGKRYLKQEYTGKFHGQNFQGGGVIGYDNVKKEYFSTWIDTMSTSLMLSRGKFDEASKLILFNGAFSCPMSGGDVHTREVLNVKGKNEYSFEMYSKMPDGSEAKMMEITYKRIR